MKPQKIAGCLRNSKLFRDSFWAIFGNGLGNAIFLLAGILIARFLGKDLYGEYGVVKTNMFYMAGFATFGLVFSSTRYISKYIKSDRTKVIGIIKSSTRITFVFSFIIAIVIALCSEYLERFLDAPGIAPILRVLSVVIVLKALSSTSGGILAGLGEFKKLAKSNVLSGLVMFVLSIPLTYFFGLYGALACLVVSQVTSVIFNYIIIRKISAEYPVYYKSEDVKELLKFSFPIALQEISYSLCNWGGILLLTKMSSFGEVGLYSASAQWNAVICVIPGLLSNVVLSHLSASEGTAQRKLLYRMLAIYLVCSAVPLAVVYILSDFIVSFYGADFIDMKLVLQISILVTLPQCCSDVFKAELIALGKTWTLFSLRALRDVVILAFAAYFLMEHGGKDGALCYWSSNLIGSTIFFIGILSTYYIVTARAK